MRKTLRLTIIAAALASVFVIVACATNPVTGKRELVLMTESQEIALGESADREIIATYGLYPDPGLQAYVDGIGQRMAAASHRPHLQWHFRVLDTPVVNAFALPGGYVYITRGTMAHVNSEAELAMVIGHEIGHVTARHGVRQYTRQMLILGGLAVGMAVNKTFRKYAPIALVGVQMMFLKFSRDQERQSDDLGVLYAYRCGYDTAEFDDFFITLQRMKETRGGGGLPGWLSTHPVTVNRIQDVQEEGRKVMAASPASGRLVARREEYLRRIDGLVYGENPRKGYTEGNAFYHPELSFRFNYPSNWRLVNTNATVQIQPKSEDAFIRLSLEQTGKNPQQVFNDFVSENSLSVRRGNWRQINGLSAYQGACDYSDDDTQLRLLVSCVSKDGYIYTFFGASTSSRYNSYYNTFTRTFNSFSTLRNRSALSRQPTRLSIRTVRSRGTVERYLVQNGVESKLLNEVLLINAAQPTDVLPLNSLIKLIR